MSELKTQAHDGDVQAFLDGVADAQKRADCLQLVTLMSAATGAPPRMWGSSIIGFDSYRYVYQSGRSGAWFLTGFAPRKANLTLYINAGFEQYTELMERLGKHSVGKSCLYIKRLSDVDAEVLRELVERSVAHMRASNSV